MIEYYISSGFLGKRVFRWNHDTGVVIQIMMKADMKKGRPHMFGIYKINENSFRSQYHWHYRFGKHKLVKQTTEKLFYYYFDKVVQQLKNESWTVGNKV